MRFKNGIKVRALWQILWLFKIPLLSGNEKILIVINMTNFKQIESIAKDVYKKLGSGHSEAVYDNAMRVGLRLSKIKYESQKVVELTYKGHYVGEGYPDIIVNLGKKKLILERHFLVMKVKLN